MENVISSNPIEMAGQGSLLAKGADEHGATIDLGSNTAVKIRADVAAVTNAIAAYGIAADELTTRVGIVQALTKGNRSYLMGARDSFKPLLGHRYNQGWDSTGLVGSLKVENSQLRLLSLLSSFKSYLTGRPALEVPSKDITILRTGELYTELENAIAAVNSQETVVENLLRARDGKARKLHSRIRGTIATLTQELDPVDARWGSFGLNQPGRKARPDRPGKLSITLMGSNAVSVKWNRAARADYYRVWAKVNGVDQDMVAVGSPADLDFTLENLPPNSVVEIAVSAINNGGESLRSEVVSIALAAV